MTPATAEAAAEPSKPAVVVVLDHKARVGAGSHVPPYRAQLYAHLEPRLGPLHLLTFGGREEMTAEREYPGLRVLCNEWGLDAKTYAQKVPWLHRRALARVDVVRAEQVYAAPLALRLARHLGKPLALRYGYAPSVLARASGDRDPIPLENLERASCEQADLVIVTTDELRRHLSSLGCRRMPPIELVPNYVRCSDFPDAEPKATQRELRLLSVGRLAPQKNFASLLEAVTGLDRMRLDVVGKGDLHGRLMEMIRARGLNHVQLLGWLPPARVFELYREADLYVQPTLAEGHPKTILEAMAAGLPIVATDVVGNRELLRHGENAWLCGTRAADLRAAIERLAGDPELRRRLGEAAKADARSRYDLQVVAEAELRAIELASQQQTAPAVRERRRLAHTGLVIGRAIAAKAGSRILRLGRTRLGSASGST
jgi:glycosyltransferase involved in cell wall biosynthesis